MSTRAGACEGPTFIFHESLVTTMAKSVSTSSVRAQHVYFSVVLSSWHKVFFYSVLWCFLSWLLQTCQCCKVWIASLLGSLVASDKPVMIGCAQLWKPFMKPCP